MKTPIIIALSIVGVLGTAGAAMAVNAGTLAGFSQSNLGNAPTSLTDPSGTPTATPTPSDDATEPGEHATPEPGDDNGVHATPEPGEHATPEPGDDNGVDTTEHSGGDDSTSGSGTSNSGSGSSSSGPGSSGSDDSGSGHSGGHGSDD